jgi:meso-butanediol dehydrogenase / (S,S)-butanediol dehydrogenase / diacetyl reductase
VSGAVLVTGGGSGIGEAIARRFAADGWRVAVNGRRPEPIAAVAADIEGVAVQGDTTEPDVAERVVADTVAALGGLDCVVLNAGIAHSGTILEQTPDSFERVLRTNVIGSFLVARAALPHVIDRQGSLIAISSAAALTAGPQSAAYCTSKAALSMLMKTIAIDYAATGIRANSVCPAWVRTDMGDAMMDELGEQQGIDREVAYRWANRFNPARRPATLDEVAGTVVFLASPAAAYVNGAAIPIDGGANSVNVGLLWDV